MAILNFNAGPAPTERVWSDNQNAIFSFGTHGTGHAVVEAVAGSGKSTTLVELMNRLNGSSVFLAFGKKNADDLAARGVNGRTFHSICFQPVLRARKQAKPTRDKLFKLCNELISGNNNELYGAFARKLVSIAMQSGVGCLVPSSPQAFWDIAQHHDLKPESENADMALGIEIAEYLLEENYKDSRVDFDDMLYFAVRDGIRLPTYDFILVDELQDTNAIQIAIVRKMMLPHTRVIGVGDSCQAIYGFRGADSQSMANFAREFNATLLPLSVSYRCAKAVVKMAKQWVPHIEAAPNAPEGEVQSPDKWDTSIFKPNDLVVCRTTKPLVELAYRMLRDRIPVKVLGREIGEGIKSLINKMNVRNLDQLVTKLTIFRDREVQKYIARNEEGRAESISDKVGCILFMVDTMQEGATIHDLMSVIDSLFSNDVVGTVLATVHKAKGLEADTVFWLNSSKCPSPWARQAWQQQQERNIMYVAVTRAKRKLVMIEDGSK